uniref:Uncharacterized protein n=1 Tax=viral metagenome TaxID=1070528 RepID=A0A6M3XGS1_9ZZZZ
MKTENATKKNRSNCRLNAVVIHQQDGVECIRMEIGNGGVCVSTGHNGNDFNNILILSKMAEPRLPIGVELPEYAGKRSIDVGPSIELLFTDKKSVQVVIDALIIIKNVVR